MKEGAQHTQDSVSLSMCARTCEAGSGGMRVLVDPCVRRSSPGVWVCVSLGGVYVCVYLW